MRTITETITRVWETINNGVTNYVNTPLTDDNFWQMTLPFLGGVLLVIAVGIVLVKKALKNIDK